MGKDPAGTLAKVAKMGYKQVEGFGYSDGKFFGVPTNEFTKILAENGWLTEASQEAQQILIGNNLQFVNFACCSVVHGGIGRATRIGRKLLLLPGPVRHV